MRALLVLLALAAASSSPSPPAVSVLFVGNSYTIANNMPAMFAAVARSMPHPRTVIYDYDVLGGATLRYFYENGSISDDLQIRHWDYVILQEQSALEGDPALFRKYATLIARAVSAAHAKPILFLTWEREHSGDQPRLTQAYTSVAHDIHAQVAPVGIAFTQAARAGFHVYQADHSHPTAMGSYLIACTLAAAIFQEDPKGAAGIIDGFIHLDPQTAHALQQIAWTETQGGK